MLKIHSSPISPFGARVVIAARAKGIQLEDLGLPPEGIHSAEFRQINPVGKVPVLVLEDGTLLPESETILRYLEDRFPHPALLPSAAEDRARVNTLIRVMDNYVMAPVIRLFPHLYPAQRNEAIVAAEVERWKEGLAALAHFAALPCPTAEAGLTMADCVLAPSFHLSATISAMLGLGDLLQPHAVLHDRYDRLRAVPVIGMVLGELDSAMAALAS